MMVGIWWQLLHFVYCEYIQNIYIPRGKNFSILRKKKLNIGLYSSIVVEDSCLLLTESVMHYVM